MSHHFLLVQILKYLLLYKRYSKYFIPHMDITAETMGMPSLLPLMSSIEGTELLGEVYYPPPYE